MNSIDTFSPLLRKPWFIGLSLIALVLVYLYADKPTALYLYQLDLRTHSKALNLLTALGKWKIYVVLFLALGLYGRYLVKNTTLEFNAWFLLACVVSANLVGAIIKITLGRARPELLFDKGLFGFYWFQLKDAYWSCPSGHALTVASLAAGLSMLYPKYKYAFIGLALLVVISRVFLYFHYISDVMAGVYLGALMTGISFYWFKKIRK